MAGLSGGVSACRVRARQAAGMDLGEPGEALAVDAGDDRLPDGLPGVRRSGGRRA